MTELNQFKSGDKVKNKDGSPFSNGEMVLTVEDNYIGKVWLRIKETGTDALLSDLMLADDSSELALLASLENRLNDLRVRVSKLEEAIATIKIELECQD